MFDQNTANFILEHADDDVKTLALQASRYPGVDMSTAIRQIAGRQRIKHKVPLFFNNTDILYPAQLSLEQASSELTARYKASLVSGNSFADLTGGLGIDCYFISLNFAQAHYIERNKELHDLVQQNFAALQASNILTHCVDAEEFLQETKLVFDTIFIDPARRDNSGKKVVFVSDCEPDITRLLPLLREKCRTMMVKLSPMLDITQAIADLPGTNKVHVVSVDNECKEIILIADRTGNMEIEYKTVNIRKERTENFSFTPTDESCATVSYAHKLCHYLYEPNSSLMKAGAYRILSERFDVQKLHPNTHLYTSEHLISNFPGRIFEIETIQGSSKQELKSLKASSPKANIAVRNYPATVDELRKKTGIKEGGEVYIFACKVNDGENKIVKCRKV
ncbi:MAG: hypothetical protein H6Q20_2133 [Bacteroidetes bacterium]|nr:hypothetical protein [Bacteroidota bacterium]